MPKPEHLRLCPVGNPEWHEMWPKWEEPLCPCCAYNKAVEDTLTEVMKRLMWNSDNNRQEFHQDFIAAVRERVNAKA